MSNIMKKMQSDSAASVSVETIIIIALAVFAALAVLTLILKPVQQNAGDLGAGIDKGVQGILESEGKGTPSFDGAGQGSTGGTGE